MEKTSPPIVSSMRSFPRTVRVFFPMITLVASVFVFTEKLVMPGTLANRRSASSSSPGSFVPFKIRHTIICPVEKPFRMSTWRSSPFPVVSS